MKEKTKKMSGGDGHDVWDKVRIRIFCIKDSSLINLCMYGTFLNVKIGVFRMCLSANDFFYSVKIKIRASSFEKMK